MAIDLPALIMSAHTPAESIVNDSKADGFIKKPFDLDLVRHSLIKYLS